MFGCGSDVEHGPGNSDIPSSPVLDLIFILGARDLHTFGGDECGDCMSAHLFLPASLNAGSITHTLYASVELYHPLLAT